ncbi:MAG TPA: hypothetical protein VGN42_11420 [Pirellulales bacterium]|nr:hypothetical protein [Pirellulales bacterium]
MIEALKAVEAFIGSDLTARIADLEWSIKGCDARQCHLKSAEAGIKSELLAAAYAVKRAAAQINVLVHAVGGLLLLPKIMEPGEQIEYVSLGAGNTGREFDLETDRRVAEFKFIHWSGGADTIRQNSLFKDFYLLAEHSTAKRKELYVLDVKYPRKFLRGGRSLGSVLSKNVPLWNEVQAKYGDKYATVSDYYSAHEHNVVLVDASPLVPELVRIVDTVALEADTVE